MKYIEPIKSLILFFLVLMSLVLTFMIWSYKPDYPFTEDPQVDSILIGDTKKISDIIKPYRMLFSTEEGFSGTVSTTAIDPVMQHFNELKAKNFTFVNASLSAEKVNEMVRVPNRMTMFFQSDIPIQTFQSVLSVEETEFNEVVFNRLIMDWNTVNETQQVQVFFISTSNETVYRMDIEIEDKAEFNELFIVQPKNYLKYVEQSRENNLSLYVLAEPFEANQYTYYTIERPELFKNLLLEDTNVVHKTVEGAWEKYRGTMSELKLNTETKIMNYVDPTAESISAITPYDLLAYSFDFVNEHGGFTDDYRFASMNLQRHVVEYQLYLQGYPVFNSKELTRISTTWGEDSIYRYSRPYYLLDFDLENEVTSKELDSGVDMVHYIERHTELDLSKIDDIVIGYDLIQNSDSRLFRLEPSWFAITGNTGKRIPTEWIRGDEYGLE
ncbi:MAG: YycH family regulatory protein [Lysinibacillus sp.]